MGRLTSTTDALSNITTNTISVACNVAGTNDTGCYEQTLTVDPNRHQQGGLVDALGRRAYIQRFTGNTSGTYAVYATGKYQYDYNGSLFRIVQPDGSTTTFTFDMAGRKIAQADPDSGQSSYGYDQNGNLVQSVDGRQTSAGTVNVTFDGLDRPLSKSTPVPSATSPTTTATYAYDAGTNGKGRLTSESFSGAPNNSLSGSYGYTYDARGQEMNRTLTVANGCATGCAVGTGYDDAGKVLTQTYPTGEVVTNTYDNAGWLNQVGTSQGNTTLLNASYSSTDYGGPAGLMTSATFGASGIRASWSHDALLRLTASQLSQCGGGRCVPNPTFSDSRSFDAAGNVTSVGSELGDIHRVDTQGFCYDEQDRLVWAGSTGTPPTGCQLPVTPSSFGSAGYQRSYSYDNLGRLTSGALGTYGYGDPNHLHAATAIGSTWTAGYDPAGNMTCRAPSSVTTCSGTATGARLAYAADGTLTTWQNAQANPTTTATFLYDGDGSRVAQQVTQNGTATTSVYVGNLAQLITTASTTTTQTYYYANGLRFAMAVNGALSYLGADALGSIESATGSSQSYALLDPYGQPRYSSGTMPTDYGFTGQHADTASGLLYYNARYYDPVAGQFTSADSLLPGGGLDIFGLSRYAYVAGNPVTRTDPSGHCLVVCAIAGAVIGASIVYGAQVIGNLQHHQGWKSFTTNISLENIGKGFVVGLIVGGSLGLGAEVAADLITTSAARGLGGALAAGGTTTAAAAELRAGVIGAEGRAGVAGAGAAPQDSFQSLADMRSVDRIPAADAPGGNTYARARLDVADDPIYGRNAWGRESGYGERPSGVNPVSWTHAEGDVFGQASRAGGASDEASLYVDQPICGYCRSSLKGYARLLRLESLNAYYPDETIVLQADDSQYGGYSFTATPTHGPQ